MVDRVMLRRLIVLGVVLCLGAFALGGCTRDDASSEGSSAEETTATGSDGYASEPVGDVLAQVQEAFEETHPGFTYLDALGDTDGWLVVGESSVVPDLIVRVLMRADDSGAITTTVEGVVWSTRGAIREFTDAGTALPADRRLALMQAVAADLGGPDSGGFCTEVVVGSASEATVTVSSDTGDRVDVPYVYDDATAAWVRQDAPSEG